MLGKWHDPRAVEALLRLLDDADSKVRSRAADELAALGEGVRPTLEAALDAAKSRKFRQIAHAILNLFELQRRLRAAGSSVLVTAAHPGWTATDLQRTSGFASFFNPIFAMKPPQGALPTLRAATDPQARAASYYGPNGIFQMRGYPKIVPMVEQARDDTVAARLWQVSEELTDVHYHLPAA